MKALQTRSEEWRDRKTPQPRAKKAAKAKAKPKSRPSPKKKAKAKAKPSKSSQASEGKKLAMMKIVGAAAKPLDFKDMKKRLELRPNGCPKCRFKKPGCFPSCFGKKFQA